MISIDQLQLHISILSGYKENAKTGKMQSIFSLKKYEELHVSAEENLS